MSNAIATPNPYPGETTDVVDAPAVVAVVVARDPGDYFSEALLSLSNQDYENLSVLVVDAGSEKPVAPRVAEVLPEAYLHRLAGDPGWSVSANQAMELVSGSPFLLFCHDDVALEPSCVSTLMKELYRSNGGIAGPKLVSWQRLDRLTQIGMGADRFGVMVDQIERGEYDQDQYDTVRDVFIVPGAVQLVRSDLFTALGGFDPSISVLGEDLDLCWRAHIAGARVLVVPDAKARHMENLSAHVPDRLHRRLTTRHRLRTVIATADSRSRFTTVPITFLLIVLEALYSLVAGRRSQAKDVISAIPWNISRLGDIRRKRQVVRQVRQKSNREVARLQVGGSAQLSTFSRGQVNASQDRIEGMVGSVRSSFAGENTGHVRDATVMGLLLATLLIFGSRHLLTRGVAPSGLFPDIPVARTMWGEWVSGWRSDGTGGPGNPSSGLAMLALARYLLFWLGGLFDTLVSMGAIFLGPIAAYRSMRPLGSPRASMLAAIAYGCNPIVVSAFSAARWDSLVLYAVAPYLLASMLKVLNVSPFGSNRGPAGPGIIDRTPPVRLVRLGFLVAMVAAFNPAIVPLSVICAVLLVLIAFAFGYRHREAALAIVVPVVATVALHGPWSYDVLRALSWRWIVGPNSPEASVDSFIDLLAFAPGRPAVPVVLVFGLLISAAIGLTLARKDLFPFAFYGWSVATVFWLITWFGRRGWLPFAVPTAESMLVFSAAGLAMAVAVGVVSVESPDNERRLVPSRLIRPLSTTGLLGILAIAIVGVTSTVSGTWQAPTQSFTTSTEFVINRQYENAEIEGDTGRVLWIGDPSVLSFDPAYTASGIPYAVFEGGRAEVRGRWHPLPAGQTDAIGRQLELAVQGQVVRLGRLLAPFAIDMVVVVDKLAPTPYEGPTVNVDPSVLAALNQQLDLKRESTIPDLLVYSNSASGGPAPLLLSAEQAQISSIPDLLKLEVPGNSAPIVNDRPGHWELEVPADRAVLVPIPNQGLAVTEGGTNLATGIDGLAVLPSGDERLVEISYKSRWRRRLAIIGQTLLVVTGALLAQTRREELER